MRNESFPLNVRLLAVLIVLGVAVAVGVYFLHGFQQRRHAEFFLRQAQEAKAAIKDLKTPAEQFAQVKEAQKGYDRYTALEPDDMDAQAECALMLTDAAKVLAQAGMIGDASLCLTHGLERLEAVLREDESRVDLRRRLVETLFALGQASNTLAHMSFLCSTPADAEALRKFLDRENLWDRLNATTEGGTSGEQRLATLLEYGGKTVDRQRLLAFLGDESWRLLEDADLLAIYARCQIQLNHPEMAEKPLERAITMAPHVLTNYQYLAKLLDSQRRTTDADFWMTEMLLANPDSFQARQVRSTDRFRRVYAVAPAEAEKLARGALEDALESVRKAAEQALESAEESAPSERSAIGALKGALDQVTSVAATPPERLSDAYVAALIEAARQAKVLRDAVPRTDEEWKGIRDGLVLAAQAAMATAKETKEGKESPDGADPLRRARELAAAAAELFPKDPGPYLVLSFIEQRAGRLPDAITWLRRGRERTGGNEQVLWQLAASLIQAQQIDEAAQIAKELEEKKASKTFITELRAEIDVAKGNWLAAAEGFERVLPELADYPFQARQVNILLAECYGKLGRTNEQRETYLQAASSDRTWLPSLLGLARLKAESGQIEEAIADYRLVMKLEDAPPAGWIELARLFLAQNLRRSPAERDWSEFEQTLARVDEVLPGSVDAIVLRARQLLAQDKPDRAAAMLTATVAQLKLDLAEAQAKERDAQTEAQNLDGDAKASKLAEAQKLGAEIQARKLAILTASEQLLGMAQQQGDWDKAEKLLAEAESDLGDTAPLRLDRAGYLVRRMGNEAAPKLRELAEKTESFSPRERAWLWRRLAPLSLAAGDDEQAALLSQRVLDAEPGSLDLIRLQFQIAMRRRDAAAMQKALGEIKRIEKTPSAFWHYGEAIRLAQMAEDNKDTKPLREAQQQLVQAARLEPTSGQIHWLAASVHEQLGEEDAAIAAFLRAVDSGVRDPATIQHIARLLAGRGRFREADRMFQILGQTRDESSEEAADNLDRQMRSVKAALGEYEQALKLAEDVAKNSTDYSDHVWLGRLLTVVGKQLENAGRNDEAKQKLAEAEEALKNAVRHKVDAPDAWVALIQFYSRLGRVEEAKAATAQAQRKLSPEAAVNALTQCYEALGQFDLAAEQYEKALQAAPKDTNAARQAADFYFRVNQTEKGEAQLRRIANGDVNATTDQRAWAKRTLAMRLFTRGTAKDRETALGWIDENLKAKPDSVDDQRAKAILLASDTTSGRRPEAIKILEDSLAAQQNPDPESQFLLAKLYLADDRWGQCKTLMRSLLRDHGRVSRYVGSFAEMLMARGELSEAAIWIKELAAIAPGAAGAIQIRAEYAFRQKQYESLITLLKEWIDSPDATDTNREQRLQIVAKLLQDYAGRLKQADQASVADLLNKEARNTYQEFVDLRPDRKLLMAEFLARQGRLDEALTVLETQWSAVEPPQICGAVFTLLGGTNANPEQIVRLDKILSAARQKAEASVDLQIAQAMVREHQDRLDEAETLYRGILQQDADNPTALNNLAVLLALREVKLDEASAFINRAIQKYGLTPSLLDTRAMVEMALGQPEKALDDLRKATEKTSSPVRLFHQAQAYYQAGMKKPAVDTLRRARELGLKEEQLQPAERRAFRRLSVALQ